MSSFSRYKRELSAAVAYGVLLLAVALVAPGFFSAANLRDLVMNNVSVLVVAAGMTLVILTGNIDISVGSQFAICSVVAGWLAREGIPAPLLLIPAIVTGGLLGALNGALVARLRIPAIVVTLAAMVALRDGLRWITQGAWVQDLPAGFQWFGLGQATGQAVIVVVSAIIACTLIWVLQNIAAGRAIYAVGSDAEAARLAGIEPPQVVFGVFVLMGMLAGLAALLNAVRFAEVPSNAGVGLELKTIAAVVVGGAAITGGRGTLIGTLVGVALLGTIGTALTFLGINPFWEKAIQGGVILAALISDVSLGRLTRHAQLQAD
ncbi:MAG TPA: ABC transporter permease [Blastocatellia bacterium]|nr:ABC transporter permease [Blastocatellia bacterium]